MHSDVVESRVPLWCSGLIVGLGIRRSWFDPVCEHFSVCDRSWADRILRDDPEGGDRILRGGPEGADRERVERESRERDRERETERVERETERVERDRER